MTHDFSKVFDTDNELWQRVLEIFDRNEKYEKKVVSNRNLHHKFPRSISKKLGEPVDNDKDNLISLSLADHFLVHYYYYKLARKGYRQPMATAFIFMAKKCIKFMTPDTAEAMAKDYEEASNTVHKSQEIRDKISKAMNGRIFSDETRRKLSEANKGENSHLYGKPSTFKGKTHTEYAKNKISEAKKGKPLTEEHRRKLSESHKGKQSYYKGKHWKIVDGKRVWY